jgi:hypothetical protein
VAAVFGGQPPTRLASLDVPCDGLMSLGPRLCVPQHRPGHSMDVGRDSGPAAGEEGGHQPTLPFPGSCVEVRKGRHMEGQR